MLVALLLVLTAVASAQFGTTPCDNIASSCCWYGGENDGNPNGPGCIRPAPRVWQTRPNVCFEQTKRKCLQNQRPVSRTTPRTAMEVFFGVPQMTNAVDVASRVSVIRQIWVAETSMNRYVRGRRNSPYRTAEVVALISREGGRRIRNCREVAKQSPSAYRQVANNCT